MCVFGMRYLQIKAHIFLEKSEARNKRYRITNIDGSKTIVANEYAFFLEMFPLCFSYVFLDNSVGKADTCQSLISILSHRSGGVVSFFFFFFFFLAYGTDNLCCLTQY